MASQSFKRQEVLNYPSMANWPMNRPGLNVVLALGPPAPKPGERPATISPPNWEAWAGKWRLTSSTIEVCTVRNLLGKRGEGPVIILGAHYDTRPLADRDPQTPDQPILGGNDGSSGVAVLLELARVLPTYHLENEIWLAFFDAEDRGHIDGWPFSVGARHMTQNLEIQPLYLIVLDMVGDAQQEIYYERNSDPQLRGKIWEIARGLGYEEFIAEEKYSVIDDHTPFLEIGVPAVDIIDFNYPFWHTTEDTCNKISPESLERVGRVMVKLLTED